MIENLSGNQMLLGLIIGLAVLIFLVLKTKIHAFVALIIATVVIGVIGGMPLVKETFPDGKSLGIIMSITKGFGGTLSGIGIIIGFGVILGKIFEISGAAQRMAITFLNLFGKKREEEAMAITGFFVSIPIFCDSGFIVVSPIAKAIARTVKKSVIGIGAALAGGLVDEPQGLLKTFVLAEHHRGGLHHRHAAGVLQISHGSTSLQNDTMIIPDGHAGTQQVSAQDAAAVVQWIFLFAMKRDGRKGSANPSRPMESRRLTPPRLDRNRNAHPSAGIGGAFW